MDEPRSLQLKWFGLFLVLAGLGLPPLMMPALHGLRPTLSEQGYHMALAALMVLSDCALAAGVLIHLLQGRLMKRQSW